MARGGGMYLHCGLAKQDRVTCPVYDLRGYSCSIPAFFASVPQ